MDVERLSGHHALPEEIVAPAPDCGVYSVTDRIMELEAREDQGFLEYETGCIENELPGEN
jgi:hypothetical protein